MVELGLTLTEIVWIIYFIGFVGMYITARYEDIKNNGYETREWGRIFATLLIGLFSWLGLVIWWGIEFGGFLKRQLKNKNKLPIIKPPKWL